MKGRFSEKQLQANAQNAKKGGVKSVMGKEKSSRNSLKHGFLSSRLLSEDKKNFEDMVDILVKDLQPTSVLQQIIIERIAHHTIQLSKLAFAKNEFYLASQNPGRVVDKSENFFDFLVVEKEPYKPKIQTQTIETLYALYHRYEVSIENRLYKSMYQYKESKNGFVS